MLTKGIAETRLSRLSPEKHNPKASYVLYWMQQSQRAVGNHALEFAISCANDLKLPLLVIFGLTPVYPEANWRHFTFMLEGLKETRQQLARRGIPLKIEVGPPPEAALKASSRAALLVCDCGYLRHQRLWRAEVAQKAPCTVVQVESDVVVPSAQVSSKAEYAARTIRPKIHKLLPRYLVPLAAGRLKTKDMDLADRIDFDALFNALEIDREVAPVSNYLKGGHGQAIKRFNAFIEQHLPRYALQRNHPDLDVTSTASAYLHFGQISSLQMALMVQGADAPSEAKEALLEELIVRRELSINYVTYSRHYDRFSQLPNWARQTLVEHAADGRDPVYSPKKLESASTHDPYWNAAMDEMRHTGYMHPYMRMYWGKKILQWRPKPQEAFKLALKLNNRYFLDGRDANSYAGVGWVFGLHDQAWKERNIFGKVRYMARAGLERKFDMQGYIAKVAERVKSLQSA